jgi:hypothetical protein
MKLRKFSYGFIEHTLTSKYWEIDITKLKVAIQRIVKQGEFYAQKVL